MNSLISFRLRELFMIEDKQSSPGEPQYFREQVSMPR